MTRIYRRVVSCICVFFVTAMHVWSLARCVQEWRPYIIQMSTGSLYQFWYYLLPRCKFGHFGTYYFYVNRHYLVQFLNSW